MIFKAQLLSCFLQLFLENRPGVLATAPLQRHINTVYNLSMPLADEPIKNSLDMWPKQSNKRTRQSIQPLSLDSPWRLGHAEIE